MDIDIGKNIQRIRKEKGLTQDELARKADMPYATLAKIESGMVRNPTINTIIKLAVALNVTLDQLIPLKNETK